jgi:hypothetical protein
MPDEPTFFEKMERTGKAMEKAGCTMTQLSCSLMILIVIALFLWALVS